MDPSFAPRHKSLRLGSRSVRHAHPERGRVAAHIAVRRDSRSPFLARRSQTFVEAALRRESLGPVVEAVGLLRACCETIRLLLEEMESTVGVHLELLDAVLRAHDGSRWWEQL